MSEQKSKNHLKQKINGNQKCAVRNGTLCCLCLLTPHLSRIHSLSLSLSASRVFFPSLFANFRNFIFADVSSYGITYHRHHHLRLFPLIHSFNILSVADSRAHTMHTYNSRSGAGGGGVCASVSECVCALDHFLSFYPSVCLIRIRKHTPFAMYEMCVYEVNGEVKRRRQWFVRTQWKRTICTP